MGLGKKLREELSIGNHNLPPLSTEDVISSITEYTKRKEHQTYGAAPPENRLMYV